MLSGLILVLAPAVAVPATAIAMYGEDWVLALLLGILTWWLVLPYYAVVSIGTILAIVGRRAARRVHADEGPGRLAFWLGVILMCLPIVWFIIALVFLSQAQFD